MHTLKRAVEACVFQVTGAITCKQYDDSRVAIEIQSVLQHAELQQAVGHFRRYGTNRHCFLYGAVCMGQSEQMVVSSAVRIPS